MGSVHPFTGRLWHERRGTPKLKRLEDNRDEAVQLAINSRQEELDQAWRVFLAQQRSGKI